MTNLPDDFVQRLQVLRDLAHLAARENRDLPELASVAWLAGGLLEDAEAAARPDATTSENGR